MAKEQTTHGGASLATLGFEPWNPKLLGDGCGQRAIGCQKLSHWKRLNLGMRTDSVFTLDRPRIPFEWAGYAFFGKKNVEPVKLSSNVSNVMNLGLFPEWQPTIFGLFAPIFSGSCCPNWFGYWCAAHWHKPRPPSGRDVALERLNRGQDRCPSVSQQTSINRLLFLLCLCSWWFLWVLCSY